MNITDLMSIVIGKTVICSRTDEKIGSWIIEFEDTNFFAIDCDWRVECDGCIITSNWESETSLVDQNENTKRLIGNKLLSCELSEHYDLKLHFENGYAVSAFCNVLERYSEDNPFYYSNWDFCVPDQNIAVIINGYFELVYAKYIDNTIIYRNSP